MDAGFSLADLKTRIEAEALRRRAAREGFTLEAAISFLREGDTAATTAAAPTGPLHYRYFEGLHGAELVAAAYGILLGRPPDAGGANHFHKLLREGRDKAAVVGAIRYSAEGRQRAVPIAGLLPRFALAMLERIPVLGSIVAVLAALLTAHRRERERRAAEELLHARIDELARRLDQASVRSQSRIEALIAALQARD